MTQRIIYQTEEGGVAVIIPTPEALEQYGIEAMARKDVPAGVPYKIIDTVDVPDDRTFRSAWEADMTSPHGVGIGQQAWFIEQYEAEIAEVTAANAPEAPVAGVAAPMEIIIFPDDLDTPEKRQAAYDAYVARITAENEANQKAYTEALANWETMKVNRIAELNKMIDVQRKELAQLQGT